MLMTPQNITGIAGVSVSEVCSLGGSENWAWKRIELHTSAHQDNHLRTLNPKYYNSLRPSSLVILTSKFWNASLKSIPNVDSIQRHFCSVGRTLLLPDLNN